MLPVQCRMARVALNWGVRDLADAAKVSTNTVTRFEGGEELKERTVNALQNALEQAGIKFIDDNQTSAAGGPGVRLTLSPKPELPSPETVQYPENIEPDAPTGAGG